MANRTAAEKAKAAKAAKAKRAKAAKAGKVKAMARPQLTQAQKDANEAQRAKEYEANKVAQAKTRLSRRAARDAIHVAALKRFWALVKNGEQFRFGDIGIKIGATVSISNLVGVTELSPADWRNVGLRCNRHYEAQGAVETVPGTKPRWFRVVAGVDPDQKPRHQVARANGTKTKSAAKKRATPSVAGAKAKAAKAKAARAKAKVAQDNA